MSPRDRDLRDLLEHRVLRRHRLARRRRRRHAGAIVGAIVASAAAIVLLRVFGPAPAPSVGSGLGSLQPIEIGQTSFVYAADGSLLGSIPAEKNREPIA